MSRSATRSSRAPASTVITGNVIADGPASTASYSIDLPDGGNAVVTGNLIEKGPQAENQAAVHFGGEGIPYAGSSLLVQGNGFVNDRGPGTVGVLNQTPIPVTISGNSFTRFDAGQVAYGPAQEVGNTDGAGVLLPDATLAGVLPGSTTFFTGDADPHSYTFTRSDTAVQGGAGHLTLTAQAGHVIAVGGAGGIDFTEVGASGGNQVVTLAGSTNSIAIGGQDSIDSEGTDTIATGHGNVTGQVGGTAVISDGTGNDAWGITGTAVVTAHGGAPQFSVGAQGSVTVLGQTDFTAFSSNGGMERYDIVQDTIGGSTAGTTRMAATITGGAVVVGVYNDLNHISTSSGGQGALIQLQAGDAAITSGGADTVWAGSDALTMQVRGAAQIHAGTGALSVFGRGWSGATIWGAGGTTLIGGDTGGITYRGGDQASTVQAVLSNIAVLGGAGLLTVQAGNRQAITGGSGGMAVTEGAQSGGNTISTAGGSSNALQVNNDNVESWGTDSISGGASGSTVHVHGSATIRDGQAGSNLEVLGQATLLGGGGRDSVTLDQGADASVQAGAGGLYLNETGATLHLSVDAGTAAAATALVQGGSANVQVGADRAVQVDTGVGVSTGVTVDGGSASVAANGADQVRTGSGSAWVQLRAAGAEVWGGAGALGIQDQDWTNGDRQTIHGGSGSLHVLDNCGALTFVGGSGTASFDGVGASLAIQGGSGQVSVAQAGGGALSFTGGTGSASLGLSQNGGSIQFGSGSSTVTEWAWGAAVAYTCAAGHGGGAQVVNGFRVGTDRITLQGVGLQDPGRHRRIDHADADRWQHRPACRRAGHRRRPRPGCRRARCRIRAGHGSAHGQRHPRAPTVRGRLAGRRTVRRQRRWRAAGRRPDRNRPAWAGANRGDCPRPACRGHPQHRRQLSQRRMGRNGADRPQPLPRRRNARRAGRSGRRRTPLLEPDRHLPGGGAGRRIVRRQRRLHAGRSRAGRRRRSRRRQPGPAILRADRHHDRPGAAFGRHRLHRAGRNLAEPVHLGRRRRRRGHGCHSECIPARRHGR